MFWYTPKPGVHLIRLPADEVNNKPGRCRRAPFPRRWGPKQFRGLRYL